MIRTEIRNPAMGVARLLGFALWTLLLLVPYVPLMALGWRNHHGYVRAYFRGVARICGLRVVAQGAAVETRGPTLYVANHASYLDIVVLNCVLKGNFVAKSEVAGWPGFGFLSRVSRTVFVDRKRGGTGRERNLLRERLDVGDNLILFPEGTSNDGNRVLPFKSSLFSVAEEPVNDPVAGLQPIRVQPVSVAYTRLDGLPMGRSFRPFFAWYGDMTLAGHLLAALGLGQVTVELVFHRPVTILDFADRKALANHCHDVVARGVAMALAGRWSQAAEMAATGSLEPLPLDPEPVAEP